MGLEVATYINQLVDTNPTSSDIKSQGDDHLRVIKGAIKRTFPNITGAVTATQDQLNAITQAGFINSPGMIMMWYYSAASIPAGWKICNGVGTLRDGRPVPNLTDRFPVGAGGAVPIGGSGGSFTHTHGLSVAITPTALTIAQMPAHSHGTYPIALNISTSLGAGHFSVGNTLTQQTTSVGGGEAHTHGVTSSIGEANNAPPYLGLFFIIKD